MKRTIRPPSPAHHDTILRILKDTGVFSREELEVAGEVLDCHLHDGEASGYLAYVLLLEDAPAGYICFGPTPLTQNTWDVYWLAVDPERQRLGMGRELVSFAEKVIKQQSGRLMLIETSSRADYKSAHKLYLASGFSEECVVKDFYSPGDSKIIFSKRL